MSTETHNDVTRTSFSQQVGLFTGDDSPFARRFASPLSWVEPLEADMIVLDVACGAGHAAEQAAPHVRQVVGIDITPALLAAGARRIAAAGLTNVLLQEADAAALPFLDNSFDLVVCRSSVHHFPEPAVVLAEMASVCRPDGRVVISDMVAPNVDVRDAFDALHRHIDPSHVHALVERELADLMQEHIGPLTYGDTASVVLPLDVIVTSAADRDATMKMVDDELAGLIATGFDAVVENDQVMVTFVGTVMHAKPAA